MERASVYLANWKESQDEVWSALLELNTQQAISSAPRSRFLRPAGLPAAEEAEVAGRTRHQVETIFGTARCLAAADVEEIEHVGLLGAAAILGCNGIIRWTAHRSLARALERVPLADQGNDTVIKHALKASLAFAERQARRQSYADVVAYGAFRDAKLPVEAYADAWRSGIAAPMALAESLLRESLNLLNEPYGRRRTDSSKLCQIASELGALIIPEAGYGAEFGIGEQRAIADNSPGRGR
jgi:hypothetical protein